MGDEGLGRGKGGFIFSILKEFPAIRQVEFYDDSPKNITEVNAAKAQAIDKPEEFKELDAAGKKFIQQVCGKFLFYGRAVDGTILVALSAIASQQSKPTTDTMAKAKQLLDYLASQEEAILTYSASKMVLAVHSDAGYLNEPNARSRAGGHFFLSNHAAHPPNNGAILNLAQIIKNVMSSATEAELGALFHYNKRSSLHPKHTHGNGSQTTCYTNPNGQLNRRRCH